MKLLRGSECIDLNDCITTFSQNSKHDLGPRLIICNLIQHIGQSLNKSTYTWMGKARLEITVNQSIVHLAQYFDSNVKIRIRAQTRMSVSTCTSLIGDREANVSVYIDL